MIRSGAQVPRCWLPWAVTDSAGALQYAYAYDPYGKVKKTTSGKNPVANPLIYQHNYNDGGSYRMGSREYRPDLGIFLSPDPARAGGLGYGYAGGNPMSALDPTGNTDEDWISVVHELSTGIAIAAGTISLVCTVVVICIEVNVVTAPLALVAGVISMATSDNTRQCISGKGGCAGAVLEGALFAAGGAFGLGALGRLAGKTAATAERAAINGETAATRLGREMHKAWNYGPGFRKEFTLPSGKRVDAINFDSREVLELKPNNPRKIREGERQVSGYVDELNREFPGDTPWTGSVITYGGP